MDYRIKMEDCMLRMGMRLDPETWTAGEAIDRELREWKLPSGVYRAQEIVREAGTILEAVCAQLGDDSAAEPLLRNLEASLAVSGREAALPLGPLAAGDETRGAFLDQALAIGTALSGWAWEFYSERPGRKRYGGGALQRLVHRSRCDRHLWTPEAVHILMGPSGSQEVMQLFNEYLHQLVLLRDALLPFENWEEVPIAIAEGGQTVGMRFIEPARDRFITGLVVKSVAHGEIVRFAQSLLCPGESDAVGYGFQYRYGAVLPAALGKPPAADSGGMLRWHPARILEVGETPGRDHVIFDYAEEDYYAAPRSAIEFLSSKPHSGESAGFAREAEITPETTGPGRAALSLKLSDGRREYRVDVGQALRGHRYRYDSGVIAGVAEQAAGPARSEWIVHAAADILRLPGLAAADGADVHYVSAEDNLLVLWALLGKLFPQNVVVVDGGSVDEAAVLRAGKQFGARFVLDRGGPRQDANR